MKQVEELVAYAESLGLASEDLDHLVHDCAQDAGLAELNSLAGAAEQEDHISAVEEDAAAVNNGGLDSQIEYLLEHGSEDEVRRLLDEAARQRS
jgi:hypothetical protein